MQSHINYGFMLCEVRYILTIKEMKNFLQIYSLIYKKSILMSSIDKEKNCIFSIEVKICFICLCMTEMFRN
jgi:hypothetical protein